MANKKTIKTVLEEQQIEVPEQSVEEPAEIIEVLEEQQIEETEKLIEVTLSDFYKKHTSIITGGKVINFVKGKAKVRKETADKLKASGFVK